MFKSARKCNFMQTQEKIKSQMARLQCHKKGVLAAILWEEAKPTKTVALRQSSSKQGGLLTVIPPQRTVGRPLPSTPVRIRNSISLVL